MVSKCKTILEEGETVDVTCVQADADLIKLLEKVFCKDQEIDIIVEKLSDKGISLTWDKTSERNQNLCDCFFANLETIDVG